MCALLDAATVSLQGAVCFVTRAGSRLLRSRARQLRRPGSFFVASIDKPTNLDELEMLHQAAPGNVYIHLGGRTPEDREAGRSLMHSKVLLAEGNEESHLWVGSHNLTAAAIAGGNFEAGIELVADNSSQPVRDARQHLEACRASAELFDPSQMDRYREIQRRRLPLPPEITRARLLVIHAEAQVWPTNPSFTVQLLVTPTDFDSYYRIDRDFRLYLHPPRSLRAGQQADFANARRWDGTTTAVVRTARHPGNQGMQGRFDKADFDIEVPDTVGPPRFLAAGGSASQPTSQVILRTATEERSGVEAYSTDSKNPMKSVMDAAEAGLDFQEISKEMAQFFTKESVRDGMLVYRPLHGMRREIDVAGYEETVRSLAADAWPKNREILEAISFEAKEPHHPIDPFFFLTTYVIRQE